METEIKEPPVIQIPVTKPEIKKEKKTVKRVKKETIENIVLKEEPSTRKNSIYEIMKDVDPSNKELFEKKMEEIEKSLFDTFSDIPKKTNFKKNEIIDIASDDETSEDNNFNNSNNTSSQNMNINNSFIQDTLNDFVSQMFKFNKNNQPQENKSSSARQFFKDDKNATNVKIPSTQEKSEKIKMMEENGDFLDLRLVEPQDYYKGFLELLTQLDHIDPIDIIQFTSYIVNLYVGHKQIWVVEDKRYNVVVGTVTFVIENNLFNNMSKYGRVEDLVVHEGIRKYGLGRTLVNHVLKIAREINCYKVTLNSNEKNEKFYENCGFKKNKIEMMIGVTPTSVFRLEHDLLNEPDPFEP